MCVFIKNYQNFVMKFIRNIYCNIGSGNGWVPNVWHQIITWTSDDPVNLNMYNHASTVIQESLCSRKHFWLH